MFENDITLMMNLYGQRYVIEDNKVIERSDFTANNGIGDKLLITDFKVLEQGCEMYLEGDPYPFRGCFNKKTFVVHQYKRIVTTLVSSLSGNIFKKIIGAIYLYFNWQKFLDYLHSSLRDTFYDIDRYQQPVREVYRLIDNEKIRESLCAILEHDTAYRFRFQDMAWEINKLELFVNPFAEIKRLINIYYVREGMGASMDKVKKGLWLMYWYLFFNRKLLKQVQELVAEADLNEIKLTEADLYWAKKTNPSYKFKNIYEI